MLARHRRLLARLGAHPGPAAGMAGGGDPRGDHPEALRLRGDRRDRRRPDHLDPRGARQRPQLGLSLLLAARRLLRGPGAQPPGRGGHPGKLPRLSAQHRRRGRTAAISSRSMASASSRSSTERIVDSLPGYRGMGPVRVGNQAHEHIQHDVYGQIVLSNVQAFFDERLLRPATHRRLRGAGEASASAPSRSTTSRTPASGSCAPARAVHTYSAVMCWAACDRLAKRGREAGPGRARATFWNERAEVIRAAIEDERLERARGGRFAATFGGDELDASLLQMVDVRFLRPGRSRATGHAGGDREAPAARLQPAALRPPGRLRRAGDGVQLLHLLVHRGAST